MLNKVPKEQIVNAISKVNPWWNGGDIGRFKTLPKRTHFDHFYRSVTQKDPIRSPILMGPRRIGKTVLVYQVIQQLMDEGVSPKKIFLVSLDNPLFRMSSLDELVEWAFAWSGTDLKDSYVFFDEIQYLSDWEQQLKVLVDQNPNTKFVATGSAAAALHKKSLESGAGRFTNYLLPPLSFFEFILIKSKLENTPQQSIDLHKLNSLYVDYLNFGGFPESIMSEQVRNQPEQYLGQDILDKVLLRDLPSLYGISNPHELQRLFTVLAYNTSNEVSIEGLSKDSGVSKTEINRYLDYLENAFLIRIVEKTDNKATRFQRRTFFKVALTNPSLRSAIFGKIEIDSRELESLAETAVFSQLMALRELYPMYRYARWSKGKDKGEVDLVRLGKTGRPEAALEIKWSDRFASGEDQPKSLISYCVDGELSKAFMTSKSTFSTTTKKKIEVEHIPVSMLCFILGSSVSFNLSAIEFIHSHIPSFKEWAKSKKPIEPESEEAKKMIEMFQKTFAPIFEPYRCLTQELLNYCFSKGFMVVLEIFYGNLPKEPFVNNSIRD